MSFFNISQQKIIILVLIRIYGMQLDEWETVNLKIVGLNLRGVISDKKLSENF